MNSFFLHFQFLINDFLVFLNQPQIKETIKNLTGFISCLFALLTSWLLFSSFKENNFKKKKFSFFLFFASVSIFLTPLTTRQGIKFLSSIEKLISFHQSNFFENETIFAVNPWVPKHILSISALLFALIALGLEWKRRLKKSSKEKEELKEKKLLNPLIFFLVFNSLVSRPTLHLTNQMIQFLSAQLLEIYF